MNTILTKRKAKRKKNLNASTFNAENVELSQIKSIWK